MTQQKTTHFGFETVPLEEKAERVRSVFDSVADKYDLMNDLMSLGIHRLWKRFTVELSGVRRGQRVLDLAAGTGDLSARFSGLVGPEGPRRMPSTCPSPTTASTASPSASGCATSPTNSSP